MIVLVVDDDGLTRALMSRTLSRLGCDVSTAENGKIALEMIAGRSSAGKRDPNAEPNVDSPMEVDGNGAASNGPFTYNYDVIFLDNEMPVLSGLVVVTKLREMGRRDFVVGVTGEILGSHLRNCRLNGRQEILSLRTKRSISKLVWTSGWHHGPFFVLGVIKICCLSSVLTKPVFETSLVEMLSIAEERRRRPA